VGWSFIGNTVSFAGCRGGGGSVPAFFAFFAFAGAAEPCPFFGLLLIVVAWPVGRVVCGPVNHSRPLYTHAVCISAVRFLPKRHNKPAANLFLLPISADTPA
jgi:hypothetical protein